MKTKYSRLILTTVFTAFCFLVIFSYCYADKVTVIEGLIEKVTDNSILVRGKYFDTTGITLLNSSGEKLKRSELDTGKKVEIFFRDGNITSILIREYILE